MIKLIRNVLSKAGLDGAITYVILARVIQAGGGLISIFFISRYLTKVEQGYYYTFGSILAIQMFFELGFSTIITQFVAHEKAFLNWNGKTTLVGNKKSLSRLSSLLQFCIKWFGVMAIIFIIVLLIFGSLFFTKYGKQNNDVEWQMPWIILALITGANLMISPILAFLEGLGKVKDVAKIRFLQQAFQLIILFSSLMLGLKLFSVPIAACASVLIILFSIMFSYNMKLLQFIYYELKEWKVNYTIEIFPFQWRIALSWISGYFIFQLFNPVVFATEGATVAGQMGMTLVALSGILSISMSWINTKVPSFSNHIAMKNYTSLDFIFNKAVKQTSIISAISLFLFIVFVYFLQYNKYPIGNRFLSIPLIVLLSIATFINQFVGSLGAYLRCHKQEPFLIMSLAMAILTCSSIYFTGKFWGIYGIVVGYTLIIIGSLFWGVFIFNSKKKEWHL